MASSCSFTTTSRPLASLAILLAIWLGNAGLARADVCVWRDPDKTMASLFPDAQDYLTVTKKMTPSIVARLEKELGVPLDESEKGEFNFYELRARRGGKVAAIGTAIALAGKGEYGTIEVVIGVNPGGRIRAVYIQRSRERANAVIRSDQFLRQFVGKSVRDPLVFGTDLKRPEGAPMAAEAIRMTIKKMLLFQRELAGASVEPQPKSGG